MRAHAPALVVKALLDRYDAHHNQENRDPHLSVVQLGPLGEFVMNGCIGEGLVNYNRLLNEKAAELIQTCQGGCY